MQSLENLKWLLLGKFLECQLATQFVMYNHYRAVFEKFRHAEPQFFETVASGKISHKSAR